MIHYEVGWFQIGFIFQLRGSVFPFAFFVAFPCSVIAVVLKVLDDLGHGDVYELTRPLAENAAFSGFSFLVGFVIVFRTGQSYSRFSDSLANTHQMIAEWFDAAGTLAAFCRTSKRSEQEQSVFLHTMVRLFSVLTAGALEELTDKGGLHELGFETIHRAGLDGETIQAIDSRHSTTILVYQWIQQLIVENMATGVIAVQAPLASIAFNELSTGMVKFHDAMKVAKVPFPFPYAQTTVTLLVFHWLLTPLVMVQWTSYAWSAGVFTFVQVFVLWCLNAIATGIEHPFDGQENDIDPYIMQKKVNEQLLLLLNPKALMVPSLAPEVTTDYKSLLRTFGAEREQHKAAEVELMQEQQAERRRRIWAAVKRPWRLGAWLPMPMKTKNLDIKDDAKGLTAERKSFTSGSILERGPSTRERRPSAEQKAASRGPATGQYQAQRSSTTTSLGRKATCGDEVQLRAAAAVSEPSSPIPAMPSEGSAVARVPSILSVASTIRRTSEALRRQETRSPRQVVQVAVAPVSHAAQPEEAWRVQPFIEPCGSSRSPVARLPEAAPILTKQWSSSSSQLVAALAREPSPCSTPRRQAGAEKLAAASEKLSVVLNLGASGSLHQPEVEAQLLRCGTSASSGGVGGTLALPLQQAPIADLPGAVPSPPEALGMQVPNLPGTAGLQAPPPLLQCFQVAAGAKASLEEELVVGSPRSEAPLPAEEATPTQAAQPAASAVKAVGVTAQPSLEPELEQCGSEAAAGGRAAARTEVRGGADEPRRWGSAELVPAAVDSDHAGTRVSTTLATGQSAKEGGSGVAAPRAGPVSVQEPLDQAAARLAAPAAAEAWGSQEVPQGDTGVQPQVVRDTALENAVREAEVAKVGTRSAKEAARAAAQAIEFAQALQVAQHGGEPQQALEQPNLMLVASAQSLDSAASLSGAEAACRDSPFAEEDVGVGAATMWPEDAREAVEAQEERLVVEFSGALLSPIAEGNCDASTRSIARVPSKGEGEEELESLGSELEDEAQLRRVDSGASEILGGGAGFLPF